jgi:hypothetical protein
MKDKAIEKFWLNVEKTNFCWNWKGYLDKSGLPVIRMSGGKPDGKTKIIEFSPRRLSIELSGQIISKTEQAQPLMCKNKLCVNPDHLIFGDEGRFWAKVNKLPEENGCWVWTASQDKDMYGKFRIHDAGKSIDVRAHQYSWQLYIGRPVPKSMVICHKCDKPYCVNPYHLFIGTTQDNTQDMVDKGRQAKGETQYCAKLTETKVKEVRTLFATGKYTKKQIADMYGVASTTIWKLLTGQSWTHVT